MMPSRLLITPAQRPGLPSTVRLLIRHPMETGYRVDVNGAMLPKNVIHTLMARFEGQPVFKATLGSGISADPYLEFQVRTPGSGELSVQWQDDSGETGEARARISIPD